MPASDAQRLYFRDKFKSLFNEDFQNWFEDIARLLHPVGDFQRIRKTSGDGALDGFVISSQLVYQVYAPARISELKDAETAAKIKADFLAATKTLSGQMKSWVFVHNHPEAALGKLSIAAISEVENVIAAKAVCVDAFALFTLRLLKLLDLLPKLCPKIFVHSAILESIIENIREMETGKVGMTISYHEGKLVRSEIGPEVVKQQVVFLRDIRDFLKSTAVELVGLDAGFVLSDDMKKAREVLGISYYEPILVSKSRATIYYADDAPMRSLASNSHGVSSFCTQALLRVAKERKLLTAFQYEDALITLLRHNYHFVSESFETLARLAESDSFQPSKLAKTLLDRVADPKVDPNVAVRVLSDFCFFIWRVDMSKANRELWLEICLNSLLRTKQPETLFAHFLGNLGIRALNQPPVFGGITHWFLRSDKLKGLERGLFYLGVQQTILHIASLAGRECGWWPSLREEWWLMGRLNVILTKYGWL